MEMKYTFACAMDLKPAYNAALVISSVATRGKWTFTTRHGSPAWSPPSV